MLLQDAFLLVVLILAARSALFLLTVTIALAQWVKRIMTRR